MIECQFCNTYHVLNTIFCNECGNCLLGQEERETDPLDISSIGWVGGPIDYSQMITPLRQNGRIPLLRLIIGERKREVEIFLNKFISLGRIDPVANIYPEIDLSEEGNLAKSVSRRHVGIYNEHGNIVIEDQASINGTFVNGIRLAPYLPETLNDGDLLQLGWLMIKVSIQCA